MNHRARRRAAIVGLAIVATLAASPGLAAAATSKQASPRPGLGVIEMVQRTCNGSSYGWQRVAADNHLTAPYVVYADRSYSVTCYKPGAASSAPKTKPVGRVSSYGWTNPLPGSHCVSGWGAPRIGHTHKGVDLPKPAGTYIRAAAAGTVYMIHPWTGDAGYYVVLSHGNGIYTVYMHNRELTRLVKVGQHVVAGQPIAHVGDSGDARGHPHLHFETHRGLWHPVPAGDFLAAHGVQVGCH